MKDVTDFQLVNLSVNFSDFALQNQCNDQMTECKQGGSWYCLNATDGCPPRSCVGTSVKKVKFDALDAKIYVNVNELDKLKDSLQDLIKNFAK